MNIIKFKTINSTNAFAKENLQELNHFDVVDTDEQTTGYGQWGRKWIDTGSQNIYLSIVLKPKHLADVYTDIVRYTAVCLCKVFEQYNTTPKIKEPNDVIINNKKIAGILAESVTKGETLKGIIIGVGINLNTDKKILEKINQPATSLNLETGKIIDKTEFTNEFLNVFETNYPLFVKKEIILNSFL
ncbi:biotin--[bacterium]|nr:biotin--[acetyl-CoA-carboxylase] ligase [bacterium]